MTSLEETDHHDWNFFDQTVQSAKTYNIPFTLLDADQLKRRFPQFKLLGTERGYYEEKAGFLRPEVCIEAQLQLALKYNAEIHCDEKVLELIPRADKVILKTQHRVYEAEKLIIAAGPWVTQFMEASYHEFFKVYRQVLFWFNFQDTISPFLPQNFPIFIWEFGAGAEDSIYGFPAIDGVDGGIKIATEQYSITTNPEEVSREVTSEEIATMYRKYIANHLNGLSDTCVKTMT